MEILIIIIIFYLLTPGILINIKGNKIVIAIIHGLIFGIILLVLNILKINIENLDENSTNDTNEPNDKPNEETSSSKYGTSCNKNEVHNIKGQGPSCVSCPTVGNKQMNPFPRTVTTNKGTFSFDGYCGYSNYAKDGFITTVLGTNACPDSKDIPVYVPSFDPDLKFCLAHPIGVGKISGDSNFNVVISSIQNPKIPIYFSSR
jgi:hypothetical protein